MGVLLNFTTCPCLRKHGLIIQLNRWKTRLRFYQRRHHRHIQIPPSPSRRHLHANPPAHLPHPPHAMSTDAERGIVADTLARLRNSQRTDTRSRSRRGVTQVRTGKAIEAREYFKGVELPPRAMRHSIVTLKYCSNRG